MSPNELFGVAVRILGLWFIANAAASIFTILAAPGAIIPLVVNTAVGAILFFRADAFEGLAYSRRDEL